MRWLAECSAEAVGEALRVVAPWLSGHPLRVSGPVGGDPLWHKGSVVVDRRFLVKFAWSRPAAELVAGEIATLAALGREPVVPFLPEVVAAGVDPVLLVTRMLPGTSLFRVVDSIDPDWAARQLAAFLAALHDRAATRSVVLPPADATALYDRFARWIRPEQRPSVRRWCDWADATPASGPDVLVHGDLHGDNQVWQGGELRLVVDFETTGMAEPEYDLRTFPGPGMGPGVGLLTAVLRHYQALTGRALSVDRVLAWHLRALLHDAVWRSEAGIPLPDHRTPAQWVDDLAARFTALGIDPAA